MRHVNDYSDTLAMYSIFVGIHYLQALKNNRNMTYSYCWVKCWKCCWSIWMLDSQNWLVLVDSLMRQIDFGIRGIYNNEINAPIIFEVWGCNNLELCTFIY